MRAIFGLLRLLIGLYLSIGGTIASLSMLSVLAYYIVGPGAFWRTGLEKAVTDGGQALISALLRIFTWGWDIYQIVMSGGDLVKYFLMPWV